MAHEVIQLMQVKADAQRIDLFARVAEGTSDWIEADPIRLRQVLLNLLGNAVKFTERGSVELVIRPDDSQGSRLLFEVHDTGIGIRPENLDRIFDPFSQEDDSTVRRFGGSGLGLAISRRLAHQMGGKLSATSAPGTGSCFTLSLPVGNPASSQGLPKNAIASLSNASPVQPTPINPEKPLAGYRLLVAEDGVDNQRLISYLLSRAGAKVKIVENGRLAVEAVAKAEQPIDLVVLDMQMPVMDGYSAAAALRVADYEQPIVALTAHAMEGDREKALKAGCDAYAAKPINAPELIALLARLARDGRPKVQELTQELTGV